MQSSVESRASEFDFAPFEGITIDHLENDATVARPMHSYNDYNGGGRPLRSERPSRAVLTNAVEGLSVRDGITGNSSYGNQQGMFQEQPVLFPVWSMNNDHENPYMVPHRSHHHDSPTETIMTMDPISGRSYAQTYAWEDLERWAPVYPLANGGSVHR